MNSLGADYSHWDGKVNWRQAKDAGIEFAFFKGSEGTGFLDDQAAANMQGSLEVAIPAGLYHWFKPNLDPIAQAEWMFHTTPWMNAHWIAADLEDRKIAVKDLVNRVHAFLGMLEDLTHKIPVIYTGLDYWTVHFGNLAWARRYPLWIANYRTDCPRVPLPWGPTRWTFWQFTDKAPAAAFGSQKSTVDLNISNGPIMDLLHICKV